MHHVAAFIGLVGQAGALVLVYEMLFNPAFVPWLPRFKPSPSVLLPCVCIIFYEILVIFNRRIITTTKGVRIRNAFLTAWEADWSNLKLIEHPCGQPLLRIELIDGVQVVNCESARVRYELTDGVHMVEIEDIKNNSELLALLNSKLR